MSYQPNRRSAHKNKNMANILKEGKTYKDVRGVVYENPYMIVDDTYGSNTPVQTFRFSVKIYANEEAKTGGYEPILLAQIEMSLDHIGAYLVAPKSASSMESPLGFAKKHVYTYLGTETPNLSGVVWSDWKSDEVGGVPQTIFHQEPKKK